MATECREMIETDNAYAAGVVDGEGCIQINATPKHTWLAISVANSDPRVCVWLAERYGGKVHQDKPRVRNGKPTRVMYSWQVGSATAGEFLKAIHPYLVIKKEQADIALAFLVTKGKGGQRVEPGDQLHRLDLIERLNKTRAHRPPLRAVK